MTVIEMYPSRLAINSIVGYPNGCKYCLLQATGNNCCFPKETASSKYAVKELLNYKYYDKNISVCLLSNTDVFVNSKNIKYLLGLLCELENNNVKNDLVIINKYKITDDVISKALELKEKDK